MFYRKNVGIIERVIRIAAGLAVAIAGFWAYGPTPIGWAAAAMAVVGIGTGLVGFCPACALVGRRPLGGDAP